MSERERVRSCIEGAARLLQRKANELSSDIEDEKVKEIYITLTIDRDGEPELDVTKTYYTR